MAVSISDIKTMVGADTLSDPAVQSALDDAAIFITAYGIKPEHQKYDILHRYYTAHILFSQGSIKITSSESVGDVSAGYENSHMQQNENPDPYLKKFMVLLGQKDVFTSI